MENKSAGKLYAVLVVSFSAIALILGVSVVCLKTVVTEQRKVIDVIAEERILAGELRLELENQNSLLPIYILTGDINYVRRINESRANFDAEIKSLQTLLKEGEMTKLLEQVKKSDIERNAAISRGIQMQREGASLISISQYFTERAGRMVEAPRRSLDRIIALTEARFEAAKRNRRNMTNHIVSALVVASVLSVLLALVSTFLCLRYLREKRASDDRRDLVLEQQKELSQARKEAVEVVAHDLRGPLASVSMAVDLIEGELREESSELVMLFQTISRSIASMRQLIDDILDHTKIEAGSLQLKVEECHLHHLLSEITERFKPLLQNKNLNMKQVFASEAILLQCDISRLDQAVSNLLSNAIKFSPEGGTITIESRTTSSQVAICVGDSGPGIPRDQCSKVFNRYWQVRSVGTQGAGLGLAIVKGIAEAHGGRVSVESEVGRGSRFEIWLPLVAQAPQTRAELFDQPG